MPSYFAGYEIVTSTRNFLVTCEDDPDARVRAQQIGSSCEADLARLNDLFSTNFETGNTSPHTIWVVVLKHDPSSNANGWNYGYESDESSRIYIRRGFVPPPPPPPPIIPPDPPPLAGTNLNWAMVEFPRFVFVAELAEILMDFTGYGWNAGQSPGEGLSNLLGALLHPAGYYGTGQGPRINSWLNGGGGPPPNPPRADFVANTANTDQDIFSYGCAILFINYLVSQRGYSLKNVIRAGGSTLAETYARLTKEPASAAYGAMNALLQAHIGSSTSNNMRSDNIFPLRDPKHRSIQTTVAAPADKGDFTDATPVSFVITPGLFCLPEPYEFLRQHQLVEQPIFALGRGMANAAFRWFIEGVEVPVRGQWTNINISTPLIVRNPDKTQTNVANNVTFAYGILDFWNGSALYLTTLDWNGNCDLKITLRAKEAAINKEEEVTAEESVSLITITFSAGEELKKARRRCNPFYARVNDTLWYLTQQLSDLRNRPDPPPDGGVLKIVETVQQLQKAVSLYAHGGHESETEVWRQLGTPGALRSADPVPPILELTQPRQGDVRRLGSVRAPGNENSPYSLT